MAMAPMASHSSLVERGTDDSLKRMNDPISTRSITPAGWTLNMAAAASNAARCRFLKKSVKARKPKGSAKTEVTRNGIGTGVQWRAPRHGFADARNNRVKEATDLLLVISNVRCQRDRNVRNRKAIRRQNQIISTLTPHW